MQVYTIPSIHTPLYPFLKVDVSNSLPSKYISQSLSFFLQDIKNKIHLHEKEWDNYKKYTNTYEYIHTNNPYKKRSVSKYKPLSRSYFKMIELIHEFRLVSLSFDGKPSPEQGGTTCVGVRGITGDGLPSKVIKQPVNCSPICTFHLAEGPGGFIEAVVNSRKNPNDTYIGMTIHDHKNDGTIPTWKKSDHFLMSNRNVKIENGADGTGDILSIENFEYCYKTYKSSMDLITADGGFDFSIDFNNQELQIVELLFAQIAFALVMQKPGGNFVLKIFDCFYHCTIDLLALLSSFYKTVYITKPQTSRSGNSEKYVVCKCFSSNYKVEDFYPYLYNAFARTPTAKQSTFCEVKTPNVVSTGIPQEQGVSEASATQVVPPCSCFVVGVLTPSKVINKVECDANVRTPIFVCRYLTTPIPVYFQTKIEEYNSGFGFYQIENIHNTITLIERNTKPDRIDGLIQKNINKCIGWCIRYNVPYNTFLCNNTFV